MLASKCEARGCCARAPLLLLLLLLLQAAPPGPPLPPPPPAHPTPSALDAAARGEALGMLEALMRGGNVEAMVGCLRGSCRAPTARPRTLPLLLLLLLLLLPVPRGG